MTLDEVIGYFQRRMDIQLDDKIKHYEFVALKALKKLEPVKPDVRTSPPGIMKYGCGVCGTAISNTMYAANYCYMCGAKIDWLEVI